MHTPLAENPSAEALQRHWLENLLRMEPVSHREVLARMQSILQAPPPPAFFAVLGLHDWQLLKKRTLSRYYPSLQVFAWLRALEQVQPFHVTRLIGALQRWCSSQPRRIRGHLERIERDLPLFALLTDNFSEEGFLSVAHHVVWRVLGGSQEQPAHLVAAVQLADALEQWFEQHSRYFEQIEITP
ncbi:MAG: hypothetical protein HQL88_08460 [Magnetococcales bacterium]|nr:hypothetical protein [Magnetococcales bacterium]